MGVRGLTTFIANRSSQYLERYELHDSYLVIDGNSLGSQLYKWHCKCNDCFGGDYDKFANVVNTFFRLLADCNITPLVILDGAYEKRKMKTVYDRIRNKVSAAKNLNSVSEGRVSLFPLLLRELFLDLVQKHNIQCVRCDFEGDNDAAHLARTLKCPILSYDSDFFIFDVLYIPFSTVDLHLRRKRNVNYIECQVYRVEKFLNSFGGLDKVNLPLLAVLLGNDYISKRVFSAFYRQLKFHKTKENEQQTKIKSVIVWLKNETPESALRKILGRYKLRFRKTVARKIQNAIEAYQSGNTPVCQYFNIKETGEEKKMITVPEPEDVETLGEEELEKEDEASSESPTEEEEEEKEEKKEDKPPKFEIPGFFTENFRRALYPACFFDIITANTYICVQQIEDFSSEHSHAISLDILAAIAKILTFPRKRSLSYLARNENGHVKKFFLPVYEHDLPIITELEHMDKETSKSTLLKILKIQDTTFDTFPPSWHLFLLSIKYWVTNSKNNVALPYVYSIILCSIVLNYIDKKVGFYRSTRSFFTKYGANNQAAGNTATSKNIIEALEGIDLDNSVACMRKLIYYFQMDAKMKSYIRLFDRSIVHELAQFQSCLLHIRYLNSLLNCPFPNVFISDFYDGTFVYNMTTNLQKRGDLKSYMKLLLQECPQILSVFELIMEQIENEIDNVGRHEPLRKRRRKRKTTDEVPEVTKPVKDEEEEEYSFDANNKFSLLSFINK